MRMSDVVVINKIDSADAGAIDTVRKNIASQCPGARIVDAVSSLDVDKPEVIQGKKVLVVEDGPTLTHGGMRIGAGVVAARKFGAADFVDPRPYTVGRLRETFQIYPEIGILLPAMGYGEEQLKDLETTINKTDCDSVVIGTPIDLTKMLKINKPAVRVRYELEEIRKGTLKSLIQDVLKG